MLAYQNYCVMNLCDAYHVPLVWEVLKFLELNKLKGGVPEHLAAAVYVCCWRAQIPRSLDEVSAMTQCFPYMVIRVIKQINHLERIMVKPSDAIQRYLPEMDFRRKRLLVEEAAQLQEAAPTLTPAKCLALAMMNNNENWEVMTDRCTSLTVNVVRRASRQVLKINGHWQKR